LNIIDDTFLLISNQSQGCYLCDGSWDARSDVYHSIEKVVNVFHDMMEGKIENNYPLKLFLIDDHDGEILEDLELEIKAGCIGGLKEVSFKNNNIKHRVKLGKRKKKNEICLQCDKKVENKLNIFCSELCYNVYNGRMP